MCCAVVTVQCCKATVQLWGKAWSQLPAINRGQCARYLVTDLCVLFCFLCQSGHSNWDVPASGSQLQGCSYGQGGHVCAWDCSQGQCLWSICSLCNWYKPRSYCPGLAVLVPYLSSGRMAVPCEDTAERAVGCTWEGAAWICLWTRVLQQRWV